MSTKCPYKVRFHYDHPVNGTGGGPIDAVQAFSTVEGARHVAVQVSRRGGSAALFYRDPVSGEETVIETLAPYDACLHEDSLYGRCVVCDRTWEEQEQARIRRAARGRW